MDLGRIVKWLVVLVVIFAIWKYVLPWARNEAGSFGKSSNAAAGGGDSSPCVNAADKASETWGGGLNRFINPPYDLDGWSNFKRDVESKIMDAQTACSCAEESCRKVKDAMSDFRGLVYDMDNAIRSGGSPGQDIVQRQEAIDRRIDEARELVRAGK
jgi:hypothetical protein